jgi:hypothetical protein
MAEIISISNATRVHSYRGVLIITDKLSVEAATVPPRTAAPVIRGLENPLPVFKRLKISLPCSVISFIKHL